MTNLLACVCGGILESAIIAGAIGTATGFGAIVAYLQNRRILKVQSRMDLFHSRLDRVQSLVNQCMTVLHDYDNPETNELRKP